MIFKIPISENIRLFYIHKVDLMNRITVALLIILSIPFLASSQTRQAEGQMTGILLELDRHNQIFYRHKLKPQESLYSLARFFKMPVEDLLLINRIDKGDVIAIGTEILIPIQPTEIITPGTRLHKKWVPLLYEVERQETLYKISKNYFPQKIENLINRNNIKSFSIKQGRQLVIGWWSPDPKSSISEDPVDVVVEEPIKKENQKSPKDNGRKEIENESQEVEETLADIIRRKLKNRNKATQQKQDAESDVVVIDIPSDIERGTESSLDTIVPDDLTVIDTIATPIEPEINYQTGIALWDKEGFERTNLFVMHSEAKIDSYIRLRYTVTGQEVTAKVISAIPEGLYPSETDIILSPAVAIALGAKDSRFQIQMNFYE